MSVEVAANVIHLLLESQYVELINPYFRLQLIKDDQDDDKFVDCAFASNATYINTQRVGSLFESVALRTAV